MTNEQIETFLTSEMLPKVVNINFKARNAIRGIFLTVNDFEDLKSKNLWRILSETKLEEWKRTKDVGLARIYNGSDFTKLKA